MQAGFIECFVLNTFQYTICLISHAQIFPSRRVNTTVERKRCVLDMMVIRRIFVAIIGFQFISWYLISVATGVVASGSSHVNQPKEKTMDETISALLTSNTLSHKELLFSSQVIYIRATPTLSHIVLGKTSGRVSFLFASKTNSLEYLSRTTDTGNLAVSSTSRSHVLSSREIPDIAGQSKSSKEPEIHSTPLVSWQNGIYSTTAASFLSLHNSKNKAFTTLQEHIASSVKPEQTSIKYNEVLNSPSIIAEKTTPNLSGKYSSEMTRSSTQVNELSPLNIALSTQIFSKPQTATNVQIATSEKVALFSKVVSESSITFIENNSKYSKSRGSPAAFNRNSILTDMKINTSGSKTAQNLAISEPVRSSKPFIIATSLEKLKITDTASLIDHGSSPSAAGIKSGDLTNSSSGFVNISSSASLEKNAIKPTGTTAQIIDTLYSTQYSLLNVLSRTDGQEPVSSVPGSVESSSVATLTSSTHAPLLSSGMSEITSSSDSRLSSTGFSLIGMRSSAHLSPSITEVGNPKIFPSPTTRTKPDISTSFLIRSTRLSAPVHTTSSPIKPPHFHPAQDFNRTNIHLPGTDASSSAAESDNSVEKTINSQTVAFATVKAESKTNIVSGIAKLGVNLTTTGISVYTPSTMVFKTLSSINANVQTGSSTEEGSSSFKGHTQSEPLSKILYAKTKSLVTAQEPSSTAVFTGKYTKQSLHDRNTVSKVLPTSTFVQATSATYPTASSLVSVLAVGTRTRVKASFPYVDVRTTSAGTTSTNLYKVSSRVA